MFETRYGPAVAQARSEFVAAVVAASEKIVAVLREHPVRGSGSYPLLDVHRTLTLAWAEIVAALEAYPLAVAVNTNGTLDKLGEQLALLGARLGHVLVFYRNLTAIPERFSGKAVTDLLDVERAAQSIVIVGTQWG